VIWHGIADNYEGDWGIMDLLKKFIPDIYVKSICIGDDIENVSKCRALEDTKNSIYGNASAQIEYACEIVRKDEHLANGFNLFGISQGGLLSRGLVQRCPVAKVKNYISFGGPQQGVNSIPHCDPEGPNGNVCEDLRRLLDAGAYRPRLQNSIVAAQYWHDPLHDDIYRNQSIFLPYLNMENGVISEEVDRIKSLESMVLIRFNQDTVVIPRDSEWFGFYELGQDLMTLPVQELPVWENLGLKYLHDQGRLHFVARDGDHLYYTEEWFEETLLPFFLNGIPNDN